MFGIKDIAKLAGTSPATVSRILNDPEHRCSSPELRDRVLSIAKENNYSLNSDARRLRKGASFSIQQKKVCCFLARTQNNISKGDQFFSNLARIIEQEALKRGCKLGFSFNASQYEELLNNASIDPEGTGLIILGRPRNSEMIPKLEQLYRYTVFVGLQQFSDSIDQVLSDARGAASTALEYLYDLGHRSIAYIGETKREQRYNGYIEFLEKKNIRISEDLIIEIPYQNYDSGYKGAYELFSHNVRPSAVFCANDITAFGVINAFRELNLRIPEDISVISVDNVDLAQFTKPMLTTVQIPKEELGHFAVDLLLSKMSGRLQSHMTISLPCQLVIRDSCRRIASR